MAGPARGSYSRFIGLVKIVLPLAALVALSTIFLVQSDDGFEGGLVFTKADRETLREGLTIRDPRFFGVTRTGDSFTVTAVTAVPVGEDADRISLDGIFARTEYVSGEVIEIRAQNGLADVTRETIDLTGGVEIVTDSGYTVFSRQAFADMRDGRIASEGPVNGKGPAGTIDAGNLEYRTIYAADGKTVENRVMSFDNGVKMTIPQSGGGTDR